MIKKIIEIFEFGYYKSVYVNDICNVYNMEVSFFCIKYYDCLRCIYIFLCIFKCLGFIFEVRLSNFVVVFIVIYCEGKVFDVFFRFVRKWVCWSIDNR